MKIKALLAALLVASVCLLGTSVYAAGPTSTQSTTTSTCQPLANPFAVTQTTWGLASSPVSAGPGSQDVPLTVTLLYTGPCTATAASFTLTASQPFSGVSGQENVTTYEVNLAADSIISESFYLDVNSSAALKTYILPLNIGYNTSSFFGLFYQTLQLPVPLKGSVAIGFAPSTTILYGGTTNNITISITNSGSGTATAVEPTASSAGQVAILNQLSSVQEIPPNSTVTQLLKVYVPSSLSGSAVSIGLSASYYDAYTVERSASQTLGFLVSTAQPDVALLFTTNDPALAAGELNNVTVTITNAGPSSASGISFAVAATSQVAILDQLPALASLGSGQQTSRVLELFVPSSLSGSAVTLTITASYDDSLSISRTATESLGFYVLSSAPGSPFVVQSAGWGSSDLSPQPGDRNVPLVLTVQYLGSSAADNLRATAELPAGFTDQASRSTAVAFASTVNPDQAVQLTFYLDVAGSLEPGTYSFPVLLQWSASVTSGVENITVSPPAVGQSTGAGGVSLSLSQPNDTAVAGMSTAESFVLKNVGSTSIYSPAFSLTASSPVVVMGELPAGSPSVLGPGQSVSLSVLVSSSPSATPGVYGGTLTLAYYDLNGNQHTENFAVGFVLTGSIVLVLQDVQVTQTSSSVTVSGSILNEGTAAAYYSSVTASVGHASTGNETADYVGEVDPNTPTTFSVTIPYQAPNSPQPNAQIAVNVSFKNSFGFASTFAGSTAASLESAGQLFLGTATSGSGSQGSSGAGLVTLVSYALIVVIVVAAVAGAIVVRRRRSSGSPAREDKVI